MISLAILWARRLWPFVTVGSLAVAVLAVWLDCRGAPSSRALTTAHTATVAATKAVAAADTQFVHDTVDRGRAVVRYRSVRDSARHDLVDTALTTRALANADTVIAIDSAALRAAVNEISAYRRLVAALRNELAISERLRAPRYQLVGGTGWDVDGHALVTEGQASVRLSERWSVVARAEKRWLPGERPHRLVFAQYKL